MKSNFFPINSICPNIQSDLRFAIGAIPPLLILNCLFGNIFSSSTILNFPKPLHTLQAPFGELKEKEFGSGLL